MRRLQQSDDEGFTLVELLVVIMLIGIVVGIAVAPWRSYQRRQDHVGATRETVALLRNAQVSAVAENQTYRVDFSAKEAKVYRFDGSSYDLVRTYTPGQPLVSFAGASFTSSEGGGSSVYFFPRGAASRGSLRVALDGTERVYTINVEGLTARVSYR